MNSDCLPLDVDLTVENRRLKGSRISGAGRIATKEIFLLTLL
jgi:hypothetical protein